MPLNNLPPLRLPPFQASRDPERQSRNIENYLARTIPDALNGWYQQLLASLQEQIPDPIEGSLLPSNAANGAVLQWNENTLQWEDGDGDTQWLPITGGTLSGALEVQGELSTTAKMLADAGIGVGNSFPATTPGTVIAAFEVFDETGASIGFVPVYDTIT